MFLRPSQTHLLAPDSPSGSRGSSVSGEQSSLWSSPATSTCDGGSEVAEGGKEERFRIDRKKLEDMIQMPPGLNANIENADVFFQRVMLETSTQISWPSKLKIGAKSKKDPHVKVVGTPENVQMAKEFILAILDTKKDRVTLKMDVSHTSHSYIIGKGGFKIQQVMEETGCHIHFPDSNRNSAAEKSNQVSIAGQAAGVEAARAKIRELLPLEFSFELPGGRAKPGDECSPAIQHIQQTYSFNVSFEPLLPHPSTRLLLKVRGCQRLLPRLRQGLALLMEYLTGSKAIPVLGFLTTEIAAQHQAFVQGACNAHTQAIMSKTGARVIFPEPQSPTQRAKSTVLIQGSFDGVCLAWQELLKYLPMVLMFDLKEGQELDPVMVNNYMEAFSVSIMVRPKIKDNTKSVLIRGAEKDSKILFQIRKDILGLEGEDVPFHKEPTLPTSALTAESLNILSSILHPQVLGLLHKLPPSVFPMPSQQPTFHSYAKRNFPSRSVESWIDRTLDYTASNCLPKEVASLEDGDSGIFMPTTANNRFFSGPSRFETSGPSSRADSSASSSSSDTPLDCGSRFKPDYGAKKLSANTAMRQSVEGGVRKPNSVWSGYGFSKSVPDFVAPGRAAKPVDSGSISEFLQNSSVESPKPWEADTTSDRNPLEQVPSPFGLSNFWEQLPRTPTALPAVGCLDDLLVLLDLESHRELFWHHEVDLPLFSTLTDADLKQMGVGYAARRKMMAAIQGLREQSKGDFLVAPGAERKKSSSRRPNSPSPLSAAAL